MSEVYSVDVEITAPVYDTEVTDRVADAITNVFPNADVEQRPGELHAETHDLAHFSELLHRREILDTARGVFFDTLQGDRFSFTLKKQAAFEGVVTFSVPYIGTVITAADSQYGFIALVVVPFLLLVLDVAYGAIRSRRTVATAADEPAELPAVYDAATAARAYYEHANEALLEAQAVGENTAFTGRDMTAAIGVALVLLAYAVWNAYWQFTAFGQPRPETMSIVSGALVGIAFLVYLRVTTVAGDSAATTAEPRDDGADSRSADASVMFASPGLAPRVAFEEEVHDAD